MYLRALTFALPLLLACALPRAHRPPGVERTLGEPASAIYLTFREWEATPWYRVEDSMAVAPWYVVLSLDRWGCLTDAPTWATAMPGDRYTCRHWRTPRP